MCDPGTALLVGTAMSALGTITSTYSNYQRAKYEQGVAGMNQQRENERARDAILRGRDAEEDLGREQSKVYGAQRAALAANGVDLSYGSAADFLGDTADTNRRDRTTLRTNYMREVEGFDISAANFGAQRQAAGSAATGALISGGLQLGTTLAGGAERYGTMQFQRRGGRR